jgi:dihydroorotate dehydrogenase electron transfer subunit
MKELTKYILDLRVRAVTRIHNNYILLRLTSDHPLPAMNPGQFVEVRVDGSPSTFLRRPISIHFVDTVQNELWLLVATVGAGTRRLADLHEDNLLNCVLPLGHGFSTVNKGRILLVGGGVGVAPLLYQGAVLQQLGTDVTFLLGARSSADLLMLDMFSRYGRVLVTTEDGSAGECGFVTQHSVLQEEHFDLIQSCGPTPMMKAVARFAHQSGVSCEVSLENMMACGLGACLCCVEKTTEGHLCVCKDGPVFNINKLLWQY